LAQALRQVERSLEEAGATVTHDPLPTVSGDGTLLVQLFQNLVGNAVKFHGERAPVIHIGVHRQGEDWEFLCADNGIGIEAQYADKIFVIFQRLHGRDVYGGTGIGLAMCKKIVEYHGGRMWLDQEVEDGATFRWTLPVRAQDLADDSILAAPPRLAFSMPPPSNPTTNPTTNDERPLDERVPAHPADRGSPGGGRPG
jgi:light-regulated signal transduction histidine kinase (bacteriophytochrome)